ncbi:MAG: hypothetical protein HYY06_21790 [Deltaproteobacteria bacterium]|nr:hypothetical protein [Deltaproteobacteria bacterium]
MKESELEVRGRLERRIHTVYVTRNTEYHVRAGVCVAVRDRRTGGWLRGHRALTSRVHGSLRFSVTGGIMPNPGRPQPGESLYFCESGRDLVTSAVESIERPSRDVVATYP